MSQGIPLATSIQYGRYIFPIAFAGFLIGMLHLLISLLAYVETKTDELEWPPTILGLAALAFLVSAGWALWYTWSSLYNFVDSIILGASIGLGYACIRWVACGPIMPAALRMFLVWMIVSLVLVCVFTIGVWFGLHQTQWTIIEDGDVEYVLFERQGEQVLVAPLMRDNGGYETRFRLLTISDDMVFQRESFRRLSPLVRKHEEPIHGNDVLTPE